MKRNWRQRSTVIAHEYCDNTSLPGWRYLIEPNRLKIEKYIWCFVQAGAITTAIFLFYTISHKYWKVPTVTSLESADYHLQNVPFPGVAICDNNRISRERALVLAERIHATYNVSVMEMFHYIQWLGRLYDYRGENMETLTEFDRILEANQQHVKFDYEHFTSAMLELTPSCSDAIQACLWENKPVDCNRVFLVRRTMYGFCCTFNYVKSPDHIFVSDNEIPSDVNTSYLTQSGYEMGLTVLLRSHANDYYYPLTNMEGFKMLVFNPHDYPDVTSGGVVEILLPIQEEVFLQIDAITVRAVEELKLYPVEQRRCIFASERTTVFDSEFYSYSDCLAECKMKSILALCNCVPFYMSVSVHYAFRKQLCTLSDLVCLNKFKEKWMTFTSLGNIQETQFVDANAIECSQCLPTCSYTTYLVDSNYAPLTDRATDHLQGRNVSELSVIHLYFDNDETTLYKTEIYYRWYDIISNFGGLCGMFMGLSTISILEILYYATIRLALIK